MTLEAIQRDPSSMTDAEYEEFMAQLCETDWERPAPTPPTRPRYKQCDIVGRRFGRLLVQGFQGRRGRKLLWLCRCDCGVEKTIAGRGLLEGTTKSCGCLSRELSAKRGRGNRTHGLSKTPEYFRWRGMFTRCYNKRHATYAKYGARGIRVCDRWKEFTKFLADMGPIPGEGFSIDRIDNDGNYEPDNCRWVQDKAQARNRRSSRMIEHGGQRLTVAEWAERFGVAPSLLDGRLRRGWSIERLFQGLIDQHPLELEAQGVPDDVIRRAAHRETAKAVPVREAAQAEGSRGLLNERNGVSRLPTTPAGPNPPGGLDSPGDGDGDEGTSGDGDFDLGGEGGEA